MKLIIYKLLFLLLLTLPVYSQVDIPFFDKIAGNWEAVYDSGGVKHKEDIQLKWTLNHNFFEIVISDGIDNKYMRYAQKEKYILTLDNEGNLNGWGFDVFGFSNAIKYKGSFNEDKILLTGLSLNTEYSVTFELKDKQLINRKEINSKEHAADIREIVYKNIRNDYKIYSLTPQYKDMSKPGLAYVCHATESYVTVFDTKTNELLGKILCGVNSACICFSTDGKSGYITNFTSNNLTVFERNTNETIATVDAGENPVFLLPINNYVLISHQSADGIWVLDGKNNTIIKKLTEGTGPLYYINIGNKIYQPQIFTPYLFILDPDKLEITKKIQTGGRPMEMAFINNKSFGYMVNFDFDEVTKFDTKTDKTINHIKNVFHPRGIASSPDGKFIYVTNVVDGKVYVIGTETDSVLKTIDGFKMPVSVAFTSDGKLAYVLNQSAGTISVIDTGSNEIIETIGTAGNPISILIDNG